MNRLPWRTPIAMLTLTTALYGCGAESGSTKVAAGDLTSATDTTTNVDVADTPDTSEKDAAARDAASPDAGPVDAGPVDAGPVDAGPVDAGTIDSGVVDTNTSDTAVVDTAVVDATPNDVGTKDVPAMDSFSADGANPQVACGAKTPFFPKFSKACKTNNDCKVARHQVDCCGTQIALSMSASVYFGFIDAEILCQKQYPQCACATKPTVAEDGLFMTNIKDAKAVCDNGVCLATMPSGKGKCKVNGVPQPLPFKYCHSNKDCTYMLHQVDCCGSKAAWGVTKTSKTKILSAEVTCAKLFPKCKCLEKPVTTEDGDNASSGLIRVQCDQGSCMTYIK